MNYNQATEAFEQLFQNKMSEGEAKDLLVSLYQRGESSQEIAAAAAVMRKYSIKLDLQESLRDELIDVVGTGGDKSGSFNISSTVAILLSSMGCKVAKHGNRAITSNSGAADMLEALGINLSLTPTQQVKMLKECGFTFMFALHHHPAMKHIMPIRKSLPHRTIFNCLGPLTNPAGVKKYLLGVFDKSYNQLIAEALVLLGVKDSIVLSSRDGMDEASISDITYATFLENSSLSDKIIDPREFGLKLYPHVAIKGGNAKENAKITMDIFNGVKGAKRDIVLLNAALALVVDKKAKDVKEAIALASEAIDSKKVLTQLKKIIQVSNETSS